MHKSFRIVHFGLFGLETKNGGGLLFSFSSGSVFRRFIYFWIGSVWLVFQNYRWPTTLGDILSACLGRVYNTGYGGSGVQHGKPRPFLTHFSNCWSWIFGNIKSRQHTGQRSTYRTRRYIPKKQQRWACVLFVRLFVRSFCTNTILRGALFATAGRAATHFSGYTIFSFRFFRSSFTHNFYRVRSVWMKACAIEGGESEVERTEWWSDIHTQRAALAYRRVRTDTEAESSQTKPAIHPSVQRIAPPSYTAHRAIYMRRCDLPKILLNLLNVVHCVNMGRTFCVEIRTVGLSQWRTHTQTARIIKAKLCRGLVEYDVDARTRSISPTVHT